MKELDGVILLYIIISLILIVTMAVQLFIYNFTYLRYDVNRDGEINACDYVLIKNYIMSKD